MKTFRMAAVLALLVGPAYAQMPHVNMLSDTPSKSPEDQAAEAERDKAYKESLKKIPESKVSNDPWGGMRTEPPKAAAPKTSAASKKAKTGASMN